MSTKILTSATQARKYVLIIFDDMIAQMISNKNFNPIVT